jgi:alpha-tubulin suppressor-like RCC1 family protein
MSTTKIILINGKIIYLLLFIMSFNSLKGQDAPPTFYNKIYASGDFSFKVEDGEMGSFNKEVIDSIQTKIYNSKISKKKIKSISVGKGHVMVLTQKGEVYTMGNNASGQLGNCLTKYNSEFKLVKNIPKIAQISAGRFHCMALDFNGNLFAWGNNLVGQLGDGFTVNRGVPVKVNIGSKIVYVDAGNHHNLAIDLLGKVWSWGNNINGELGDGTNIQRSLPVLINIALPVTMVTASSSNLALLSDGSLLTWGNNEYGQLGIDSVKTSNRPVKVPGVSSVIQISSGDFHCFALDRFGFVWSWGRNNKGQLIDGSTEDRNFPAKVSSDCLYISSGGYHNLIIKTDYTIWVSGESPLTCLLDAYLDDPYMMYKVDQLISPNEKIELIIVSE